jgi:hypothetical protein
MKPAERRRALVAARLSKKHALGAVGAVAKKLRVDESTAQAIMFKGLLIEQCEAHRLTDNEMLVMKALARVEARRIALGEKAAKANQVDFAAGKRSGWSWSIVKKRILGRLVGHTSSGHIWLTPDGWAFVWAAGLILKNWRVPA